MIKKQDFQKEGNSYGQKSHFEKGTAREPQQAGEAAQGREAGPARDSNHYRESVQGRNQNVQKDNVQREYSQGRESLQTRGFHKDIQNRHMGGPGYQSHQPKFGKIKLDETIDDIKQDIARIEKEIDLEIKEIKSMKLGL